VARAGVSGIVRIVKAAEARAVEIGPASGPDHNRIQRANKNCEAFGIVRLPA